MADTTTGKIKAKLKSGKALEIFAIVIFAAVVVAVLLFSFRNNEPAANAAEENYISVLETKLSKALSEISGVGTVQVVITAESEGEQVLAMETVVNEDGSVTTRPVLVNGEVVVIEEKNPEITGVLIVAEGADNLGVRFNLLEAAASVLNINQSIIQVYTKGGN